MQVDNEFALLLYIYEETELKNQMVNFTKIKNNFLATDSLVALRKASHWLDEMTDQGMLTGSWQKDNASYSYCYFIDKDFLGFTEVLYNFVDHPAVIDKHSDDELEQIK